MKCPVGCATELSQKTLPRRSTGEQGANQQAANQQAANRQADAIAAIAAIELTQL